MVPNMKTSSQRVDCFENGSLATMTVPHLATYQSCHSSFESCHFNVAFKYSDAGTAGPGGQIIPKAIALDYPHLLLLPPPQKKNFFSPSGITDFKYLLSFELAHNIL